MMSSISVPEFLKIKNQVKTIDIRSVENYNRNHIPGAINIPWEKLLLEPHHYLLKNEVYYLYCQKGIRTKQVCNILSNEGYRVVNIIGGYEEWIMNS